MIFLDNFYKLITPELLKRGIDYSANVNIVKNTTSLITSKVKSYLTDEDFNVTIKLGKLNAIEEVSCTCLENKDDYCPHVVGTLIKYQGKIKITNPDDININSVFSSFFSNLIYSFKFTEKNMPKIMNLLNEFSTQNNYSLCHVFDIYLKRLKEKQGYLTIRNILINYFVRTNNPEVAIIFLKNQCRFSYDSNILKEIELFRDSYLVNNDIIYLHYMINYIIFSDKINYLSYFFIEKSLTDKNTFYKILLSQIVRSGSYDIIKEVESTCNSDFIPYALENLDFLVPTYFLKIIQVFQKFDFEYFKTIENLLDLSNNLNLTIRLASRIKSKKLITYLLEKYNLYYKLPLKLIPIEIILKDFSFYFDKDSALLTKVLLESTFNSKDILLKREIFSNLYINYQNNSSLEKFKKVLDELEITDYIIYLYTTYSLDSKLEIDYSEEKLNNLENNFISNNTSLNIDNLSCFGELTSANFLSFKNSGWPFDNNSSILLSYPDIPFKSSYYLTIIYNPNTHQELTLYLIFDEAFVEMKILNNILVDCKFLNGSKTLEMEYASYVKHLLSIEPSLLVQKMHDLKINEIRQNIDNNIKKIEREKIEEFEEYLEIMRDIRKPLKGSIDLLFSIDNNKTLNCSLKITCGNSKYSFDNLDYFTLKHQRSWAGDTFLERELFSDPVNSFIYNELCILGEDSIQNQDKFYLKIFDYFLEHNIDLYISFHKTNKNKNNPNYLLKEEKNLKIIVSDDGDFILDPEVILKNIIFTTNYIFYLDEENYQFYRLNLENKYLAYIVKFIVLNPNFNFKPYIKELLIKHMEAFEDNFKISEKLLDTYEIKKFHAKVFFDLDEKNYQITFKNEYYFDNLLLENSFPNDASKIDTFVRDLIDKNEEIPIYFYKMKRIIEELSKLGFEDSRLKDETLVANFTKCDLSNLKKMASIYVSNSISSKKIRYINQVNAKLTLVEGWVNAHIYGEDLDNDSLKIILSAYRKKKKYVLVKDDIIAIDETLFRNLDNLVNDLSLNENFLLDDQKVSIYNIFSLQEDNKKIIIDRDEEIKNIIDEIKNYKNFPCEISSVFKGIIKEYQLDGYKWLKVLEKYKLGGILADDMGLGKTIQMIALLEDVKDSLPILIVCPKSLVYNWSNEFKKFNSSVKYEIVTGTKLERESILKRMDNGTKCAYIISFDTLKKDSSTIQNINFSYAILDEAQNIKNMESLRAKTVKEIKANHKFVLTGTPIENALTDLWSIFDFLMPGYLGNISDFRVSEKKMILENDTYELKRLIAKTKPFILRRTKSEVAKFLPEKTEEIIYGTFEKKSRDLYKANLLLAKEEFETNKNRFGVLKYITILREICISPSLIYENFTEISTKVELAGNLIKEAISGSHKVILFSSFVKGLNLIEDFLNLNKIKYFILTGDTAVEKRFEIVSLFNSETSPEKVFLVSLKAGGVGLNLTGADIVIHLDPWWNIAAYNQANDRTHRIGQTKNVHIYKIIISDSIEEKVLLLQESKRQLVEKVIFENDEGVSKLSLEDYKYLLS
ncbi:MAG: DEAD/DEAH box helicase [Acholeplasmatales bacterium]|jgi:SNF2 family DNA or RNA helicase|nr:DEAD/DEAH box helicase [Acholeplasmatales bacterium]